MPHIERTATLTWDGNVARGVGSIAAGTGAFSGLGFSLPTREAVDALYAELTGAGYTGRQRPYDTFFGARYAVVADPDGNDVGLMSPLDDNRRSMPPTDSPD